MMQHQKRDWDELATLDPLWAILSAPEKRHGAWNVDAFLHTGRQEVDEVLRIAAKWRLPVGHGHALDFGCGVGRVTAALAVHFESCLGLDISDVMVTVARRLHPQMNPTSFRTIAESPLSGMPDRTFDFIYSNIVLQHMQTRQAIEAALIDFTRLLKAGGLLVFQLPSHIPFRRRLQLRPRLYNLFRAAGFPSGVLYSRLGLHPIRMFALPESAVVHLLQEAGTTVVTVQRRHLVKNAIDDRTYFVTIAPGGVPQDSC